MIVLLGSVHIMEIIEHVISGMVIGLYEVGAKWDLEWQCLNHSWDVISHSENAQTAVQEETWWYCFLYTNIEVAMNVLTYVL